MPPGRGWEPLVIASLLLALLRAAHTPAPPWLEVTYGGAAPGGQTPLIPSYRLAYPPGWSAHLWPDTLASYGQLDLWSPAGSTIELVLLPLRRQGPTLATLLAHDAAALGGVTRDQVALPLGRALRLTGTPLPPAAGRAVHLLYLQRHGVIYRLFTTGSQGQVDRQLLLQVAATLRSPLPGPVHTSVPRPPPPPQQSGEGCCHCPAWGTGWGLVLTHLDGLPVYWNGGDGDNGCVGTYGLLYQCVELVQRYFAVRWGYPPIWRGVGGAADMRWSHPPGIAFIPNGGTPAPQEGDALLFYGGAVGHVALVQRVDAAAGTLSMVEENWSPTGEASVPLYASTRGLGTIVGLRDSAYGSYTIAGWLHSAQKGPATAHTAP